MGLPAVRALLQGNVAGELFVVREAGRLFGTITLADLSEAAFDPAVDGLINAGDVARLGPPRSRGRRGPGYRPQADPPIPGSPSGACAHLSGGL